MSDTLIPSAVTAKPNKQENPFLNLAFNILLPIFVLNKGTEFLGGAGQALIVALLFPISYGVYDLIQRRKVNAFSIVGMLNVLLTGGLALSGRGGIWFSIKEAIFPLVIGVFVAGSAFSKKPLIKTLVVNPQAMRWDLVEQKLKELGKELEFDTLIKRATLLLSGSFLVSAILNFGLAERIFLPIGMDLPEADRARILNEQIAEMTGYSFIVIMIPSMVMLIGILFYLFRGMTKTTGLKLEEIMK